MTSDSASGRSPAIAVQGLVKTFGTTRALDGLDLDGRPRARCTASSVRTAPARRRPSGCCSGCCGPTRARSALLGGDPWPDAVALHRRLAYVPGDVTCGRSSPAARSSTCSAGCGATSTRPGATSCSSASSSTPPRRPAPTRRATGRRWRWSPRWRRGPSCCILDEPTSGLDPLMEAVFQDCIREVKAEGRTVLLSSHILAEVEALCDRVSIIRAGRTVQSGTLARAAPPDPHVDRPSRPTRPVDGLARPAGRARLDGVDGHRARFDVDTDHLDAVVRRLADARHPHAWRASRRRSRSCSCATTATRWPTSKGATTVLRRRRRRDGPWTGRTPGPRRRDDGHVDAGPARPAARPGAHAGLDRRHRAGRRGRRRPASKGLYPTQADLDEAAAACSDNAAAIAFNGPDVGARHDRRPGRVPDRRVRARRRSRS